MHDYGLLDSHQAPGPHLAGALRSRAICAGTRLRHHHFSHDPGRRSLPEHLPQGKQLRARLGDRRQRPIGRPVFVQRPGFGDPSPTRRGLMASLGPDSSGAGASRSNSWLMDCRADHLPQPKERQKRGPPTFLYAHGSWAMACISGRKPPLALAGQPFPTGCTAAAPSSGRLAFRGRGDRSDPRNQGNICLFPDGIFPLP